MDFLKNKDFLRQLLQQGDAMNTVGGGVRQTDFEIVKTEEAMIILISNESVSPEAFNFIVNKEKLLINVVHMENLTLNDELITYPMFYKEVIIPYYVDINKIEATLEKGKFKIKLPYNNNLPKRPFTVRVRNKDN